MQYIVKVTKGADGKCTGGSGMIKSEQCLCEKGQECQGFKYPGSDVEFSKTTLLSHSCLILCFFIFLLKSNCTFESMLCVSIKQK